MAVLILVASTMMIGAINRQTRRLDLEAVEGRQRLLRALRVTMPDDLDAIRSYAYRSAAVAR